MPNHKTQYVVFHDNVHSPPSSTLLTPRITADKGWLRLRQWVHRYWMLEAIASVLSLLIFMEILFILYNLDNSIYGAAAAVEGDKNKRPHIFPILAISSAVMRATMLLPVATAIGQLRWSWFRSARRLIDVERFDEASRGIIGSAKLIFYVRFRNFATIGAALTILALPLDALIQSAIRMPSKVELVHKLRDPPPGFENYRSSTFLRRSTTYSDYQIMTDPDDVWPEVSMVNAIQYGLGYSNGPGEFMQVTTSVYCPTGYCEFPKMQTLDIEYVCSLRNDVEFVQGDPGYASYQTLPGTNVRLYVEGYKLAKGYNNNDDVENHQIAVESYSTWPTERSDPSYSIGNYERDVFNWTRGPLIARTSMLVNRENIDNYSAQNSTYGIDCALYWNVRTTTGYVNSTSNYTLGWEDDASIVSNFTSNSQSDIVLTPLECVVNGYRVSQPKESSPNETYYNDNCIYQIHNKTHVGLQSMLKHPYSGLMGDLALMHTIPTTNQSVWNERNPFIMNLEAATWQVTPEQALYNVTSMWHNMAYFADNTVRSAENYQSSGSATNLGVNGTISALVTYYSVDWARLAVPAFIVLSCALFVVYTAIITRKEYAWRRSALPLLFHGLEDHERHAQGDVRDFNAMQDAAKDIRVRLTEHVDDTGARLTTQR